MGRYIYSGMEVEVPIDYSNLMYLLPNAKQTIKHSFGEGYDITLVAFHCILHKVVINIE